MIKLTLCLIVLTVIMTIHLYMHRLRSSFDKQHSQQKPIRFSHSTTIDLSNARVKGLTKRTRAKSPIPEIIQDILRSFGKRIKMMEVSYAYFVLVHEDDIGQTMTIESPLFQMSPNELKAKICARNVTTVQYDIENRHRFRIDLNFVDLPLGKIQSKLPSVAKKEIRRPRIALRYRLKHSARNLDIAAIAHAYCWSDYSRPKRHRHLA